MSKGIMAVRAPAKLTRTLEVVGVRPDGLHEINAEMVSLDLADELMIDPAGEGLSVQRDGPDASAWEPAVDNLIDRALRAVGRVAGVVLVKRVPVGGGLGGGSADAAAVLRWAGCTDLDMAAQLGADVPFCLIGGRARVTGIGEVVSPLPFEPRSYVLLAPPFGVDTRSVYAAWDDLAGRGPHRSGPNALTEAALMVEPRLAQWRDLLAEVTGRQPVLAGSGSTWFVEGSLSELGLEEREISVPGAPNGRLLGARAVPSGWNGEPETVLD